VFQVIAEATFLEWLGDRIDNITDENGAWSDRSVPLDPRNIPLTSR
jgi:hypothetical protein